MLRRSPVLIALLSASLLGLEMAWTRIFSAEFFYTFAFLVLSLAVLGLGAGALLVRLWPGLAAPGRLGGLLALTAVFALAAPPLVFVLGPEFGLVFGGGKPLFKLLAVIALLNLPFVAGGMALASLLRRDPERVPGLYAADMVAAAAGVLGVIALMNAVGTPAATFWLTAPLLLAVLLAGGNAWRAVAVLLLAGIVLLTPHAPDLLRAERPQRAPVIHEHWDAAAKVKVYDYAPEYRGLEVDNAANSPLLAFDGNWDRPDSLRYEFGIDVSWLLERADGGSFLSLGAGGGGDVMQALQAGCDDVHAVEVVPYVNRMLQEGEYAEFTGGIYNDPRVTVATEDARAYARARPGAFDMIYSLSSNSWAALASGAFALSENYLFTEEAFRDYWRALTPSGHLSMEHQFYVPRLVSCIVTALEAEGVAEPLDHLAVYDLPSMRRKLMLVSRQPLTEDVIRNAYGPVGPETAQHIRLLHPVPAGADSSLVAKILGRGWRALQDSVPVDLSPPTDDRPFAAQLGLWRNVTQERLAQISPYEFMGFPVSKLLIVVVAGVALVLGLPLTLLPLLRKGPRLGAAAWGYFFCIGAAYMAVEVVLIQRLTLLVGLPLAAIATVLCTLLAASGAGSLVARRVPDRVAFVGLLALLLGTTFLLPLIIDAAAGLERPGRTVVAVLVTAPLGFFMGLPFPKGALRVGDRVDWGLAVNGVASVLGSTLVILLALTQGFTLAMGAATLVYAVAAMLHVRRSGW